MRSSLNLMNQLAVTYSRTIKAYPVSYIETGTTAPGLSSRKGERAK